MQRVLIASNQLFHFAGSELVALEFAQHFKKRNADVVAFANIVGGPMRKQFERAGVPVIDDPGAIKPLTFDLVYMQHHVAALFDYGPSPIDRARSLVVLGRLSPTGFLESGGWGYESAIGDLMLANSLETAASLTRQGCSLPVRVFHNAAPADFHHERPHPLPDAPRRVIVVTNHEDGSLRAAIERMRERCDVLCVGLRFGKPRAVSRSLLQKHDLVVTIGKTVQYALASRVPVFVYDKHGGPGYLNDQNWKRAAAHNFSGRCTPVVRSASDLVAAIFDGYAQGRAFAEGMDKSKLSRFFLPRYLNSLGEPTCNETRRRRLASMPSREREMADYVRDLQLMLRAARAAKPAMDPLRA